MINKTDVVITLPAHSNEFDLLYFAVMAKLHLPEIKPIFLKILYKRIEGTYYTLAPFLYSQHLYFTHSLTSFKTFIKSLRNKNEERYAVRVPGYLVIKIIFSESSIEEIYKYKVTYPIPEIVKETAVIGEIENLRLLRESHQKEINRLDNTLAQSMKIYLLSESKAIIIKLRTLMMPINIINKLIVSTELRYNIKDAIATSLIKGEIKYQ